MFRLIGAAALALAATNPAFAQGKGDGNPGKGGGKPDHAAMNDDAGSQAHGHDKGEGSDPGGRDKAAAPAERGRGPDRAGEQVVRDRQRGRVETPRAPSNRRADDRDIRDVAERTDYRNGRNRNGFGDRDDWDDRWVERDRFYIDVPSCPPGLAKKNNGCLPPGLARQVRDETFGYDYRPALFGIPLRAAADYVYYDGYLIPASGSGHFLPLLGGALAVGQIWPEAYPSLRLNDWQRDYYGFDGPDGYRYADNVIYDVDPTTSAIEAIVALLTGNDFAVGQRIPDGYDVYNVPAAYQDRYYDTDDSLYRYADGQILQVDPTTMLVEQIIGLVV